MARCPNCDLEIEKPNKEWNYAQYEVKSFVCKCGTQFRNYFKDGSLSFSLKRKPGSRYVKA